MTLQEYVYRKKSMLASTAPDIATCRAPSVVTSIPAIGAETQDITHASNKQVGRFTWCNGFVLTCIG